MTVAGDTALFGQPRAATSLGRGLLLLSTAVLCAACDDMGPRPRCGADLIAPTRALTDVGDTLSVILEFSPPLSPNEDIPCEKPGPDATVLWISSDTMVAVVEPDEPVPAVDQTVLVTARGEGTARISTEIHRPGEGTSGCGPGCGVLVIVDFSSPVSAREPPPE